MAELGLCETTMLDARSKAIHAERIRHRTPKLSSLMLSNALKDMETVRDWTIMADLIDEAIQNGNSNRIPPEGSGDRLPRER